jgi:uncharacterized RDD family membrane protein YckC
MFNTGHERIEYGGFLIRLWAGIVDGFAAIPIALLALFIFDRQLSNPIAASIVQLGIVLSFEVLLVAKFGGSPGKLASGLRILDVSLAPASARQAFIRALPNILVAILRIASTVVIARALGAQLQQLDGLELQAAVRAATPGWANYLGLAAGIWFFAEFVSMMANDQRRALHDHIAGTVVVKAASLRGAQTVTSGE